MRKEGGKEGRKKTIERVRMGESGGGWMGRSEYKAAGRGEELIHGGAS